MTIPRPARRHNTAGLECVVGSVSPDQSSGLIHMLARLAGARYHAAPAPGWGRYS
ncbi:MAG: hypothetical protein KDB18_04395 [Salinibacterium sp.]|nr:hypothetical protein [Salinibacterium sp.]